MCDINLCKENTVSVGFFCQVICQLDHKNVFVEPVLQIRNLLLSLKRRSFM